MEPFTAILTETFKESLKEAGKEGVSGGKGTVPEFAKGAKAETITSFEAADKPVRSASAEAKSGAIEIGRDNLDTQDATAPSETGETEVRHPLTAEQRSLIQVESSYSRELIEHIGSWEEYEIYKDAGLNETEIGGRKALLRDDIDFDQKDAFGRSNTERIEQGLSPLNKEGKVIELHHIGQKNDSPLAELTAEQHRGKQNYSILHEVGKESEIDRTTFNNVERQSYWRSRLGAQGG